MNPSTLYTTASSTPLCTPQCECAMAVCQMRGIDPYAIVGVPWGFLPQWQALILEQLLLRLAAL